MDGGGRKRRKLTPAAPGTEAAAPTRAPTLPQASASLPLAYATAPPPANEHVTPAPTPSIPLPSPQDPTLRQLPDVSEAVRNRVAQQMQGVSDPFLLADKDSASEEEASPGKRKRRTIKSGMLHTQDTHVVIRIKWPHEVVSSSQSKVPVYEEMSLASFTNGYLGLMAEEKGSPVV